ALYGRRTHRAGSGGGRGRLRGATDRDQVGLRPARAEPGRLEVVKRPGPRLLDRVDVPPRVGSRADPIAHHGRSCPSITSPMEDYAKPERLTVPFRPLPQDSWADPGGGEGRGEWGRAMGLTEEPRKNRPTPD